ncbi:MAG: hypothetical protein JWQ95_3783 [Sphaerisporangium sp.]|jgi:hypothetical protein|nr:hypothetical protein [Sphaerisporangium sp.]
MTADMQRPTENDDEKQPKPDRGGAWIAAAATVVTAVITVGGTFLAGAIAPTQVSGAIAPGAAITQTATHTVTATATATVTVTPSSPVDATPTDPTSSPGALGDTVYLTGLEDSVTDGRGSRGEGPYAINGKIHPNTLGIAVYTSDKTFVEYTTDGTYQTFNAILGLNDELKPDSELQFVVSGNGKVLSRKTVPYAREVPLSVPIGGYVKLRIEVSRIKGARSGHDRGAVLGDARLSR